MPPVGCRVAKRNPESAASWWLAGRSKCSPQGVTMSELYHSRQSFLGEDLPEILDDARLAFVGMSGGGSHVLQQAAHVGFQDYTIFEPKCIGLEHLHRH